MWKERDVVQLKSKSAKRKLLSIGLFLAMIAILACGTVAYYTTDKIATNVITAGNIDISIVQQQISGDVVYNVPFVDVTEFMPGEQVSRVTSVVNSGGYDVYIRVSLDMLLYTDNGFAISSATTEDENPVTVDVNTTDWTYQDGYYYYNEPVAPGAATKPLFTTVSFSSKANKTYEDSTVYLDIDAYGTQVINNGDNVFEAEGWPVPEE